jgi:hypothetical protein
MENLCRDFAEINDQLMERGIERDKSAALDETLSGLSPGRFDKGVSEAISFGREPLTEAERNLLEGKTG